MHDRCRLTFDSFDSESLIMKPKKVSFSPSDDVAYIYPCSPTKYLLLSNLTTEQLLHRKIKNECKGTIPILKKPRHCVKELFQSEEKVSTFEVVCKNQRSKKTVNTLQNNKTLSEIIENTVRLEPSLPSRAIFSPSNEKNLITNVPIDNKPEKSSTKPHNKHLGSKSLFERETLNCVDKNYFPHLLSSKLGPSSQGQTLDNEINNLVKMPSLVQGCKYYSKNSSFRSQISQRYTISHNELDHINVLGEEDFADTHTLKHFIWKAQRHPLPPLLAKNELKRDKKDLCLMPDERQACIDLMSSSSTNGIQENSNTVARNKKCETDGNFCVK